ncbi:exported protein of unknown function [Candidatus Methylomirabilis oxygeniifera]|uniref:Uncharacterized protein n=1 Tax=Methylomirabilis oxygeniifera TaxID=671143 RepID=D5MGS4_METO1|nr:exported protein of unknown function [Candidatus Methylomirabilis oxyfera]
MQRLHQKSVIRLRLKTLAAASFGFYLLLNAFLTHCLINPHNAHLQGQATTSPLASLCAWVHKTVSPHTPSVGLILPIIAAALFIVAAPLQRSSQFQPIKPIGRSPPQLCFV